MPSLRRIGTLVKCAILYIAVSNHEQTTDHIARFAASYHENPPEEAHDTIVCCNGGPIKESQHCLLAGVGQGATQFWPRPNDEGRDIAAYIAASKTVAADYDMVLCLGESVHFWKAGWLKRIVEVWQRYGKGMYGVFATHVIRAHLQTTAFATAPEFLREYPLVVNDKKSRYEFEHGERALWRRLRKRGFPTKLVTWSGDWNPGAWRLPRNGIWKGDQSDCLMWCNHTDRWFEADEKRKRSWQISADRPFK